MNITANRYHDISCGHRVVGHESKCAHLHGHNYRVHFSVKPESSLDKVGRVLDFSVIKSTLCEWLEKYWDHKMLIWVEDAMLDSLIELDPRGIEVVAFNPTAENMAKFIVEELGPKLLEGTGAILQAVTIEETRKCSVTYELCSTPEN